MLKVNDFYKAWFCIYRIRKIQIICYKHPHKTDFFKTINNVNIQLKDQRETKISRNQSRKNPVTKREGNKARRNRVPRHKQNPIKHKGQTD